MKIEVTLEDIRCGIARDCCRCPVARAMERAGLYQPIVSEGLCWTMPDGRPCRVATPRAAVCFAADFDRGLQVEPFDFEIDVVAAEEKAATLTPLAIATVEDRS